jgi:hypothetical protein
MMTTTTAIAPNVRVFELEEVEEDDAVDWFVATGVEVVEAGGGELTELDDELRAELDVVDSDCDEALVVDPTGSKLTYAVLFII